MYVEENLLLEIYGVIFYIIFFFFNEIGWYVIKFFSFGFFGIRYFDYYVKLCIYFREFFNIVVYILI